MTVRIAIVGAGITGLTVAQQIIGADPAYPLVVLDAGDRPGGVVRTELAGGYTLELGPNGFVDNGRDTGALARTLGLGGDLLPASPLASNRWLLHRGRLHAVPRGPRELIGTRLLSARGKLRMLAEPVARRPAGEESVYEFVARRLGTEAASVLADPMVRGICGGDSRSISLDALFPQVRAMEARHGSLLRAAVAARRAGGGPRGRLTSFRAGGMGRLVGAMANRLGLRLRLGQRIERMDRVDGRWRLDPAGGPPVTADAVVLTVPAHEAARLLGPHLPAAAGGLATIGYSPIRVTYLGYERRQVGHRLDGFGMLAAAGEACAAFGVLCSSTTFDDQAPAGHVLLRAFSGGAVDPAFCTLSAPEAIEWVHAELATTFAIVGRPAFSYDHVWRHAIPQYRLGHRRRVDDAIAAARTVDGLFLAGSGYHGVGVNDCVRSGQRLAADVLESLTRRVEPAG